MTFIPWSPDEDERLRKLALSGASMAEIAQQMQRTILNSHPGVEAEDRHSPRGKPDAKGKACGT